MAYHLKRGEGVPLEVRRIAREELESAAQQLSAPPGGNRDEAIHEARKSIKKYRAVLRLMRPELADRYKIENRRMGNVGRQLSELRDAGAIIETFDQLRKKYQDAWEGQTFDSVRNALLATKKKAEDRSGLQVFLESVAATLSNAAKRVDKWPLHNDGFSAIAPGLEDIFRRGRRALAQARKHPNPENFHEWRKRVKDHWYHIRLLESLWTDVLSGYERSLKDLETWLGDDHNLVLLREKISTTPAAYGKEENIDLLLDSIAAYQKELRANAVSLGKRIYEEKPRHFIRRMEQLWDDWQSQPKSLKEAQEQPDAKTPPRTVHHHGPAKRPPARKRRAKQPVQ